MSISNQQSGNRERQQCWSGSKHLTDAFIAATVRAWISEGLNTQELAVEFIESNLS
jgi:ribulose bisphosphate carboxylase small subunit